MRRSPRRVVGPLVLLMSAGLALAQPAFQPQMPPPSPLFYVRFTGPTQAKITIYRGFDKGQTLELPCTVGFRPGYAYRFALHDVPSLPRQVFCPSLEVRGTLALTPKLRNADFPAHVHFTEDELGKVVLGTFIKKVITLERPDQAIPVTSTKDAPLEVSLPSTRDPYVEAAERGQPLATLQMGQRFLTMRELNSLATPGTILLPGERTLGTPRIPPYLSWNWHPVHDPIHGPRHPHEFSALYDGGDSGPPAGFGRDGKLVGLNPTDTIAEYTDSKGNKRLAASNRVALTVPRFLIFKTEQSIATQTARTNLDTNQRLHMASASVGQMSLKEQANQQRTDAMGSQLRLSETFNAMSTSVAGRSQGLEVRANLSSPASVAGSMAGPQPSEPADGPLRIIKWPDKLGVNIGEVVTFYLKYTNTGGQPITSVVVSDSLTPRLEYVKGSTRTDRDAVFTMERNESGGALLRWEFSTDLPPREHGLISFQVKVR